MKIQTGTNINCKPQTTFALSGIACFIAFLLSGTFAVAAPAPSVQPQKPDISTGTDPVRPTDLESTSPTGFVDKTPIRFGSKVTLNTSNTFNQDSILNYSKTNSSDKTQPISFSNSPNASLTFKDHRKLFKTPLQFRLARTSNCHAGQIAVTSLLKGTFEELPISFVSSRRA